ncbi:MAG TPA: GAF domain-containing protein, partial [Candidatus Paceibacterota bacterium]|nr:GAF domain-containing protein [Candidatus Paceibacterota bacterium]
QLTAELIPHDRLSVCLRPDGEDYLEMYVLSAVREAEPRKLDQGARLPLRSSPPGEAYLSGRIIRKQFEDESASSIGLVLAEAGYRSGMVVPLHSGGRSVGTLNFAKVQAGEYTDEEAEIAQDVADHLASPIEHAYFRMRLLRQAQELTFLNELSTSVNEAANVHDLLEKAHERLRALSEMEGGAVLLMDEERQVLRPTYDRNMPKEAVDWLLANPVPAGKYIPGISIGNCRILVIDDADQNEDELLPLRAYGVKTHLCIPLVAGERALGLIGLIDRRPRSFSQSELKLFTTAGKQLGLALERASLIQGQAKLIEREQLLNQLMQIAASSLDVRDVF